MGGKGLDDRESPDLATDPTARLIAILVEGADGTVSFTRGDVQAVSDRLMLVIRESEDTLLLETRHLRRRNAAPE